MDLETFQWLLTEEGQALLAHAEAADLRDAARLGELTRLRKLSSPERASAAYEIAWARARAAGKFSQANTLYFIREALEQSSGERISRYRARRYGAYGTVADLACGAGGDLLALAQVAQVIAVDRDRLRLAMAEANAMACGVADRVRFVCADLEQSPPPPADAIFFDPSRRRESGKRVSALRDYTPPVSLVREWRVHTPAIGVKVSPGVSDEELAPLNDDGLEIEFISVDGELKEAVLWFGPLGQRGRRATVLRSTDGANANICTMHDAEHAAPSPQLSEPDAFLYEPDPSIIRAHLIAPLAGLLGAAQIDPAIAYLTGPRPVASPFARCWRVITWLPFHLKRLRARLRELDAGAVTVKKRGSPIETDALARQLSASGARPLVVILSMVAGQPAALICEGPIQADPSLQ